MDLPVSLTLLPAAGRARASGYRSVCRFEGIIASDGSDLVGFELEFVDSGRLEPGETAPARMRLWADSLLPDLIPPGTSFTIYEGLREVGIGEVVTELPTTDGEK